MAIDLRLSTTRYLRPGVYIGQVYIPRPVASLDIPRIPCYIGRGWNSKLLKDYGMTRGYITEEQLNFVTTTAPFRAQLSSNAYDNNKNRIKLYKGLVDKEEVDQRLYEILQDVSGDYRLIQLSSEGFDPTGTYYIDYLSKDIDVPDKYGSLAGITGTQKIFRVGLNPKRIDYVEGLDYKVITQLTGPTRVQGTSTGSLTLHSDSEYKGPTRNYTVLVENETTVNTPIATGPTADGGNSGTGTVILGDPDDFTGSTTVTYTLTIANHSGSNFRVNWVSSLGPTGHVDISTSNQNNVELELGLKVSFDGLADFANSDIFTITLTMTAKSVLDITWFSDDPQGASGQFTVNYYNANIDSVNYPRSRVPLENNIFLSFGTLENFDANDEFEIVAVNTDSLSWDLVRDGEEVISASDIFYDHAGTVVGTRRTFYVFLEKTQITDVLSVTNATTGAGIPFVWVQGENGETTPYISFASDPGVNLSITYKYRNAPLPGQGYYVTVQYKRPDSDYNTVLFTTRQSAKDDLGWPSPENHLAIMTDHAYESFGQLGTVGYIQVKDADGDGAYTTMDFRNALTAARYNKEITDLCVLGHTGAMDTLYQVSLERNSPFEGKESLTWIGFPNGTKIGFSDTEEGTLRSYANSLQVYGDDPRGLFVLLANTWCKRTIQLEDGTTKRLTLDGSFIAGAMAALRCSFDLPHETELRKTIPGYDDLQNYNDFDTRNVGSLGYTYLERKDGLNRVVDVQTIDFTTPDFHYVNAMAQKQFVTKYIRRELDRLIIGIVPLSIEQGVFLIRTALAGLLRLLVSRQVVAPYNDPSENEQEIPISRDLDVQSDISVFRDAEDPTVYHMQYWFVLRYHIRLVLGLYSVDQNLFKAINQ